MKTKISILLLIAALSFNFYSCKDEVVTTLELDKNSIEFTTNEAAAKFLEFETNSINVRAIVPSGDNWCSASIVNNRIKISVKENESFEERTTVITIDAGNEITSPISVSQAGRIKTSEKKINSFIIKADKNNLKSDIQASIDNVDKLIKIRTNEWIGNAKELIVDFQSPGTLYVNNEQQISGESTQSFFEELIYTVKDSDGTSEDYKVSISGPMFTGLPVVSIFIDGDKEVVNKKPALPASFNLTNTEDYKFDMSNTEMSIRGRGNSTWEMPKKPYRIDFPSKTSLFGLPAAKKWVFLANYQDPTLLMNDIAFELGRRFGLEFNHSSIHVEMFINGTYRGNYQMTEQKEVGKGRVDIDTNGGFLTEIDTYFDEDYKFYSEHFNLPVMVADPSLNNEDEMQYIKDAFHEFERTLYGENFPSNDYEKYTDVNSLINFILINEFVRNQELHHPKSTYMYKSAGEKIKWGPLWDFDWAFGFNGSNAYFKQNNLLFYAGHTDTRPGAQFFSRFFEIPGFKEKYLTRWKEVKPIAQDIVNYIDTKANELNKSQHENFNIKDTTPNTKNATYGELISQMKKWIENRIEFLDKELAK